jgi:hypothetical protein
MYGKERYVSRKMAGEFDKSEAAVIKVWLDKQSKQGFGIVRWHGIKRRR